MSILGFQDQRHDSMHALLQRPQVIVERLFTGLMHCLYRATAFMPKNTEKLHVQMLDCIFHGCDGIVIHDVARIANLKEAPDMLIENHFRTDAAVGATQNRHERMLAVQKPVPEIVIVCGVGRKHAV